MKPIRSTSTRLVLPLLAMIGLTACDSGAQTPSPPGGTSATADVQARPLPAEASSGESYQVTVGSGPFAGTHRGTAELSCMVEDGSWQADFIEERDRGISMLNVLLDGVPESGGTTEDAHVMVTFGRLDEPGDASGAITLGAAVGGTARATAKREGAYAVMRVEGTTSYGANVSVVVRCSPDD